MSRIFRSYDDQPWEVRYGNGDAGDITISSPTTYDGANAGISGNVSTNTYTVPLDAASSFADGDIIYIHQTRGTGYGAREYNKIASGGGTTTLTLEYPLQNDYYDGGSGHANQAQIIEIKQYNSITVNDTWKGADWNGNTGGLLYAMSKTTIGGTSGTISVAGVTGDNVSFGNLGNDTDGGGFYGGRGSSNFGLGHANSGEGTLGPTQTGVSNTGHSGGGTKGAGAGSGYYGGSGGGHKTAGSNAPYSTGGTLADDEALLKATFGGGGGGAGSDNGGGGGSGGGGIGLFGKAIDFSGLTAVTTDGGDGETTGDSAGAGAGGYIELYGDTVDLGTGVVHADGGVSATTGEDGGNGADGIIAVFYGTSISGTSSPTYYSEQSELYSDTYAHEGALIKPSVGGALTAYKRMVKVASI